MKRILFIGHEASKTGAPTVLLHLLRWLKRTRSDYFFDLLLLTGGELESEFRKVCNVHVLRKRIDGTNLMAAFSKAIRFLKKIFGRERRLLASLAAKHSLVFSNTAVSLEMLKMFNDHGSRTICWMHELDHALDTIFPRERFFELAESVDGFIVGSNAVRDMLLRRGITKPIDVVYEFVDVAAFSGEAEVDIRDMLGIPANAFVVGGCATIESRKGPDLFVQIARRVIEKSPDIYFLWVGGRYPSTEAEYQKLRSNIVDAGLENRIIFTDIHNELSEYYRAMDIFILPSREDPFPLVCLEAAIVEKPILCFERAGGMPEFVGDDAGFAVPYLDVDAMAAKIGELEVNPDLRKRMGKAASARVRARHDVSEGAPEIVKVIERVAQER